MFKSNDPSKEKKRISPYLRLTSAAIQMGAIIFLGAQLGKYLDRTYPNSKNWYTIGFTLLAVTLSLYNLLRQVNKINSDNDKK